jgi:hypothetical protein
MSATLTLQVSDELLHQLQRKAAALGTSPEAVAVEYLSDFLSKPSPDRLLRWAGAFASAVPDAAERHDEFLGQALADELNDAPGT